MTPLDRVLQALDAAGCRPRATGDKHQAKCPHHNGKDFDSLTISEGTDGRVLLTCHSRGCEYADIMHALGLEPSDGFVPRTVCVGGKDIPARRPPDTPSDDLSATYDYTDEKGRLLYQVLRYRRADGTKTFRQRQKGTNGDEWLWTLKGVTKVLYRLPDVRRAIAESQTIYLVEGEKDVETLRGLGLVGTCAPGGACEKPRSWLPQYTEALRGAEVVILPDNDDPGRKHAEIALEALENVARRCRVVTLPDLPEKGDVSDWVSAGGTAATLRALCSAPELVSVDLLDFFQMDLPEKQVFIEPWLRSQDLVLIHAWRGVGKTWFTGDLAIGLATGTACINWNVSGAHRVLYVDGEMPASMLRERFAILAANKTNGCGPGWFRLITPDLQTRFRPSLKTAEARGRVEDVIRMFDPEVLFLDNLSSLYGGEENDSSAWDEMQDLLLRWRSDGRTVFLVHHSGKGGLQRGTSRREDVLDTVIQLVKPKDHRQEDGARFEVKFEKVRADSRQLTEFEAKLCTYSDNTLQWEILNLKDSTAKKVVRLLEEGLTQQEIAHELSINKSNVSRAKKLAEERGWI
jgi:5S rRNA maturation endonuclease (ribonuclease M5)